MTAAPWTQAPQFSDFIDRWQETLQKAQEVLAEELALPESVPGGMAAFRQTLALSFLQKFYIATSLELAKLREKDATLPKAPVIQDEEVSGAETFLSQDRPVTYGSQSYVVPSGGLQSTEAAGGKDHAALSDESRAPVGQPLVHKSALPQCTGEAPTARCR